MSTDAVVGVGDGVAVGVGVEEVGDAVAVGVGRVGQLGRRHRAALRRQLEEVDDAVAVVVRIDVVGQAVVVGVDRVGRIGARLLAIADGGVVGIVGVEVEVVGLAVGVAVDRRRARVAVAPFDGVGDAVAVGVGVEVVGRAVAVGVARRLVVAAFVVVADAVAVGVFWRHRAGGAVTTVGDAVAADGTTPALLRSAGGGKKDRGAPRDAEAFHVLFLSQY